MRAWSFGRVVAIGGFAMALALAPQAATASKVIKVIYSFAGGDDGAVPVGPLVDIAGTFYGTTSQGGGTGCGGAGCGTVFSIGPNGGERVIHRFAGSPDDGATPLGGLVNVGGTLYGTTFDGGKHKCTSSTHCGTVYSVGVNGAVTVIYSFKGGKDGAGPSSDMVLIGSHLYGTTFAGGGGNGCDDSVTTCGTFYSVTTGGAEKVLHVFGGVSAEDGGNPSGSLIEISNRIYGTTEFGGLATCTHQKHIIGCGVVYSMTTGGGEKVLHAFKGGHDGELPTEGVIDVAGELFGTTSEGGESICGGGGCGVLYSMSTGGTETILHTFAATAAAGLLPSGLIFYSNNLYGVTFGGGNKGCANTQGCGIAYSASTGGNVTVLHNFGSGAGDAEEADSRLIALGSKLYGVSHRGGTGKCSGGPDDSTGCGTVYQLTP